MRLNDNWLEARDRLTALWRGEKLDRPCLCVTAPGASPRVPWPEDPPNPEDRWLNPDMVLRQVRSNIGNRWWGAEAIPSSLLMAGWVVSLNGTPHFDQKTIWFETQSPDFSKPSPWRHDPAAPWVGRFHTLHLAVAAEAGWDNFLLGAPLFLPAHDLLSMHMGTQEFLMALIDQPEWMLQAITDGARDMVRARNDATGLVKERHAYWYGNAGWMPFWAPEPYKATQSDVSCMLSPAMFDEFVLPELQIYAQEFGSLWYHLDGGDARQHLPRLLSLPYIRVIQYVPTPSEPPNGTAHLAMYRRIQEAGKIVHIQVTPDQVEPLCKALDPSRLMLMTSCKSVDAGREMIANAVQWSRMRHQGPG